MFLRRIEEMRGIKEVGPRGHMYQSTTGKMTMKLTRRVLGHSLIRSHRSLIRLLRCAHSLARSLARSLTRFQAHGKEVFVYEMNASISYDFYPQSKGVIFDFQMLSLPLKYR